ncbi:hypothetical protein [Mycobacterium sp. 852002-30065_SCH5024008]|uniref:hypothetical protein n=1 Tax=Mycobacterium sp. 852002-30065_SCH5024008 TaxID=1834088 RepID=UPI0007FD4354|nr:hypothetical protein [Mycobacterium sp. 852002-30065_SCH5024008]OBB98357.1 hypothetical protein A5781_11790 [Mycobacterium sp. 852002-30065_SCH5024008]
MAKADIATLLALASALCARMLAVAALVMTAAATVELARVDASATRDRVEARLGTPSRNRRSRPAVVIESRRYPQHLLMLMKYQQWVNRSKSNDVRYVIQLLLN